VAAASLLKCSVLEEFVNQRTSVVGPASLMSPSEYRTAAVNRPVCPGAIVSGPLMIAPATPGPIGRDGLVDVGLLQATTTASAPATMPPTINRRGDVFIAESARTGLSRRNTPSES